MTRELSLGQLRDAFKREMTTIPNNAKIAGRKKKMETSGRKWKGNLLKEGRRKERKNLNTYTRGKNSQDEKWEAKKTNVMLRWFLTMDILCVGFFCLSRADAYTLWFFSLRSPKRPNVVREEIDWKGFCLCCAHFRTGRAISPFSFAARRIGQLTHLYFYLSDVWEDIAVSIMVLFYPISIAPHLPRPF